MEKSSNSEVLWVVTIWWFFYPCISVELQQVEPAQARPQTQQGISNLWSSAFQQGQSKFCDKWPCNQELYYFLSSKNTCKFIVRLVSDFILVLKVKRALGGHVRIVISGGAPLSSHVEEYLRVVMCAPILQGYGMNYLILFCDFSFLCYTRGMWVWFQAFLF